MDRQIVVVAHNIRSTFNVGSLLRTCDGLGVEKVFFCGYTPYPHMKNDSRLPHISEKLDNQIHKTALGAEKTIAWQHEQDPSVVLEYLKEEGYEIIGLEQINNSVPLHEFITPAKAALVIGEEVHGLEASILAACDRFVEIPMFGHKESFNVAVASAMALYHFRFS